MSAAPKLRFVLGLICLLGLCTGLKAADARIIKILPHLLDAEGRAGLGPSLYERDAYQIILKGAHEKVAGLRFDVQWKAGKRAGKLLTLRVEVRGSKTDLQKPRVFETKVEKPRMFSKWSAIHLDKTQWQEVGDLIAWRATLWDGEKQIAEQQSFLW